MPSTASFDELFTQFKNLSQRLEDFMAAEKLAFSIIDQAGEVIIVCDERGISLGPSSSPD